MGQHEMLTKQCLISFKAIFQSKPLDFISVPKSNSRLAPGSVGVKSSLSNDYITELD